MDEAVHNSVQDGPKLPGSAFAASRCNCVNRLNVFESPSPNSRTTLHRIAPPIRRIYAALHAVFAGFLTACFSQELAATLMETTMGFDNIHATTPRRRGSTCSCVPLVADRTNARAKFRPPCRQTRDGGLQAKLVQAGLATPEAGSSAVFPASFRFFIRPLPDALTPCDRVMPNLEDPVTPTLRPRARGCGGGACPVSGMASPT